MMVAVPSDEIAHLSEPPMVKGLPLIGNTLEMAKDPAAFFADCYRQYGEVFQIRIFGRTQPVIAGANAAIFMNTREGKECLRSKEFWEGLVQQYGGTRTLTGEDGDSHKELRAIMKRGYSKKALEGHYPEMVEITDRAIKRRWQPGEKVPVVEAMQYMVVEQLGMLLTGEAPLDYVADIRRVILNILNVLVTRQRPGFMLWNPKYKASLARMVELKDKMVEDYFRTRDTKSDQDKTLIDDIMEAHVNSPDVMPAQDLMITLTGPYVAGLDTVANTEAAFVYGVLKDPEIKARIQAEVDAFFADPREIDAERVLKELPCINGAIMEAMRLYPIAVAQMRTATRDFEFGGHLIKKDSLMFVATSVPHFMEEYFPNPKKFDIDRYEKPRQEHLQPGAYSPYGRGPHTCLGQSLAEVQMALGMARLMYLVDMELEFPGYELKTKTAPTPGPAMNFKIKVNGYRH